MIQNTLTQYMQCSTPMNHSPTQLMTDLINHKNQETIFQALQWSLINHTKNDSEKSFKLMTYCI